MSVQNAPIDVCQHVGVACARGHYLYLEKLLSTYAVHLDECFVHDYPVKGQKCPVLAFACERGELCLAKKLLVANATPNYDRAKPTWVTVCLGYGTEETKIHLLYSLICFGDRFNRDPAIIGKWLPKILMMGIVTAPVFRALLIGGLNLHAPFDGYSLFKLVTASYRTDLVPTIIYSGIKENWDMLSRDLTACAEKMNRAWTKALNTREDAMQKLSEGICKVVNEGDWCIPKARAIVAGYARLTVEDFSRAPGSPYPIRMLEEACYKAEQNQKVADEKNVPASSITVVDDEHPD